MSELTDEILSNIDIVDVVGRHVQLKRSGVNFSGLCPFHNEKTPSFVVSPQKQIFKCFGCGVGGNVITFVKDIERADFWDAIKILAKDANVDLSKYENKKFDNEKFAKGKQMVKDIHQVAQQFFVDSLKKSDLAKEYLANDRKLEQEIIDKFGVAYAPNSYYEMIQYLRAKGFSDIDIQKASLSREKGGDSYAFFRNRITFPIFDAMGNIVAFSARILDPKDKPKYINSSEHAAFEKSKILYGLNIAKNYIKEYKSLIVVEGQMDVLALYRLGWPIGIATCGTALTAEHIKIIKRYTDNVYLLFDNDKAGQQATIRAMKTAYQKNIFPKIIHLEGDVKDIDDLANMEGGKEIFEKAKDQSKDALLYIISSLASKMDLQSPVDKQRFLYQIFSIILNIDNVSMQDHYLQSLSEVTNIPYEVLIAQFRKFVRTDGSFDLRAIQNKDKEESYKMDRGKTFLSLFYNNFVGEYTKTSDIWTGFLDLVKKLAEKQKDSLLNMLVFGKGDVLEDIKQDLIESQLWREEQLGSLDSEQKQYEKVKEISNNMIHSYWKEVVANKDISHEEKGELSKLVNSF